MDINVTDPRSLNQAFLDDLKRPGGLEKWATLINEEITLTTLREDGITRRLLKPKPVTPQELDFDENNPDLPVKYMPVEPVMGRYLAAPVDYGQATRDIWFKSSFYKLMFYPIKSNTIKLTEAQIIASKWPIRVYLESVIRNDILAVEDFQLIEAFERCVALTTQVDTVGKPWKMDMFADIIRNATKVRGVIETLIMNEGTFADVYKWTHSDVGSYVMKDIVETGIMGENYKYKSYAGFKWILTNNEDIIPQDMFYALMPERMLGHNKELLPAESWCEFRDGVFRTNTREIIARGISNAYGVFKYNLT